LFLLFLAGDAADNRRGYPRQYRRLFQPPLLTAQKFLQAPIESIKTVSRRLDHADFAMKLQFYAAFLPADDARLASRIDALYA
jgi:hypothetical protein